MRFSAVRQLTQNGSDAKRSRARSPVVGQGVDHVHGSAPPRPTSEAFRILGTTNRSDNSCKAMTKADAGHRFRDRPQLRSAVQWSQVVRPSHPNIEPRLRAAYRESDRPTAGLTTYDLGFRNPLISSQRI